MMDKRQTVNPAANRASGLPHALWRRCAQGPVAAIAVVCAALWASVDTAWADETPDSAIVDYTSRVIGGTRSATGQWPWTIAMIFEGRGSLTFRQFCGGTAIADRWVLTAAHCLYDFNEQLLTLGDYTIAAGFTDLATDNPPEISPVNAYIHPLYDNTDPTAQHDLALIELASDLPVDVLTPFLGDTEGLTGELGYTMGWGAIDYTNPDNPTYPDEMRHAAVPLVARSSCNVPTSYNGAITEYQVCAGYVAGGVDACVGDSGGPLVMPIDGAWRQVGIVSFGRGCAEANFYGVYTSVAAHSLWINDYVSGYRNAGTDGGIDTGTVSPPVSNNAGGAASSGSDTGATGVPWLATLAGLLLVGRFRRKASASRNAAGHGLLGCVLALVLSSCMSTQSIARLDDSADRIGIEDAHLGDVRDAVMATLTGDTREPDCRYDKVGLAGSPRPIRLEVCTIEHQGLVLADAPVQRVMVHFVDDRLARMSFAARGEGVRDDWQQMLTAQFGEAGNRQSPVPGLTTLYWTQGDDEVRLVPGDSDDTASQELVLVDARLERRASWLR